MNDVHFENCGTGIKSDSPIDLDMKKVSFKQIHNKSIDISDDLQKPKHAPPTTRNKWYKKPVGVVILSVIGMFLFTTITLVVKHYFPQIGL
jgi:hypothetical protein